MRIYFVGAASFLPCVALLLCFLLVPTTTKNADPVHLFTVNNGTRFVNNNTRIETLSAKRVAVYLKHSSDALPQGEGPCCQFINNGAHWVSRNEPYRIYQPPSALFVSSIVDGGNAWTQASGGNRILGTAIESGRTFTQAELALIDADERNFVAQAQLDWLGDPSILAVARLVMDTNLKHIYQWGIIVNTENPVGDAVHDDENYDLRSVINHELGHVYGLGHQEGCANDLMFPYLAPGTTRGRQIDSETRDCVRDLYSALPVDGEVDEVSAAQSIGWSVALHLLFILFV
jgi:hypothetical protein